MKNMATLKKYKPKDEKELHTIIENELDNLEEGLELLKHEMDTGKGIPDFLCVDSGRRIVIIEVKLHGDEDVLFQALKYYNKIDKDRYAIPQMFPNKKINAKEHPRIILIAEEFSDEIRQLATLVVPDVELYEYTVVIDSKNNKGIVFHPVTLPKIDETLTEPTTIQDHIDYITKEDLKPVLERIRNEIKSIGNEIKEYPTQYYIGFKFRGRQFAWIGTYRKYFDLGAHIIDDKGRLLDYESIRIEDGKEDYSEIMKKIKEAYNNLGGKLNEEGRPLNPPNYL